MNELNTTPNPDSDDVRNNPDKMPASSLLRELYTALSSAKLAMVLLVVILALCLTGVTVFRGPASGRLIFNTLWFNSILVLLVLNVCFCFFGRIWGRKLTLVSFGMILFHLSFVLLFLGIIYNSFYFFRGEMRLTEGETLPNGTLESYDSSERGILFDLARMKGETTLVKMHTKYKVDGADKQFAYEIAVGEGGLKKQGLLYITHHFDYKGFRYFCDREGYSVLTIVYDKKGRELYGAHVPLQSLKQKDDTLLYTTGNRSEPATLPFPQMTMEPLMALQVIYHPVKLTERAGEVTFKVWPPAKSGEDRTAGPRAPIAGQGSADPHASVAGKQVPNPHIAGAGPQQAEMLNVQANKQRTDSLPIEKPMASGTVSLGKTFRAGDHMLSVNEVRYWVIMHISYEPGLPIVLASLWVGLGGIIITFIGRIRKGKDISVY